MCVNQVVLNRWKNFFTHLLGTVQEVTGETYLVEDSVGNTEEISRENIISDEDDAANSIQVQWLCKSCKVLTSCT